MAVRDEDEEVQTNCRRPTRYDLNQRMLQPPIPNDSRRPNIISCSTVSKAADRSNRQICKLCSLCWYKDWKRHELCFVELVESGLQGLVFVMLLTYSKNMTCLGMRTYITNRFIFCKQLLWRRMADTACTVWLTDWLIDWSLKALSAQ